MVAQLVTPLQTLKGARALLAEPERWTKHAVGRAKSGYWCEPSSSRAVCWCSDGAIQRSAGLGNTAIADTAVKALADAAGVRDIWGVVDWNDAPERTHAEVLAAFDTAIARLEART